MQPPAEHVHWLFATGFLLLGLCLLAEAVVGTEVWRRRAWRAYLWPGLAFALGVLLWPVMMFFTNSTLHMLAHGAWARGADARAAPVELALVRGKLQSSRLAARRWPSTFLVSGAGLPRARAERLVVPAVVVPASPARVDAAAREPCSRSCAASGRARTAAAAGFALTFVVIVGDAVLRSRRRAGLRPHRRRWRGRRTDETPAARRGPVRARASVRKRSRTRRSRRRRPGFEQRVERVAAHGDPPVRPVHRDGLPARSRLYSERGSVRVVRMRDRRALPRASLPRLHCRPAATRFAGTPSPTTGTLSRACSRSACASRRPSPTDAYGASGPTRTEDVVRWLYFLSLALLVGGLGFRAARLRGRPAARSASSRHRHRRVATLNVGIAGFVLRAEDALQLPFGRLLYGDLSARSRGRASAPRSSR